MIQASHRMRRTYHREMQKNPGFLFHRQTLDHKQPFIIMTLWINNGIFH